MSRPPLRSRSTHLLTTDKRAAGRVCADHTPAVPAAPHFTPAVRRTCSRPTRRRCRARRDDVRPPRAAVRPGTVRRHGIMRSFRWTWVRGCFRDGPRGSHSNRRRGTFCWRPPFSYTKSGIALEWNASKNCHSYHSSSRSAIRPSSTVWCDDVVAIMGKRDFPFALTLAVAYDMDGDQAGLAQYSHRQLRDRGRTSCKHSNCSGRSDLPLLHELCGCIRNTPLGMGSKSG
jgi:hypothetical protein